MSYQIGDVMEKFNESEKEKCEDGTSSAIHTRDVSAPSCKNSCSGCVGQNAQEYREVYQGGASSNKEGSEETLGAAGEGYGKVQTAIAVEACQQNPEIKPNDIGQANRNNENSTVKVRVEYTISIPISKKQASRLYPDMEWALEAAAMDYICENGLSNIIANSKPTLVDVR